MDQAAGEQYVTTSVPQRLDRLPWSHWHLMVVIALGVTWLLDGRWEPNARCDSAPEKAAAAAHMQ